MLPLNLDLASAPILSTTGVARSMPTSAVSSAEKTPEVVSCDLSTAIQVVIKLIKYLSIGIAVPLYLE
jgi:hypothetical protein